MAAQQGMQPASQEQFAHSWHSLTLAVGPKITHSAKLQPMRLVFLKRFTVHTSLRLMHHPFVKQRMWSNSILLI